MYGQTLCCCWKTSLTCIFSNFLQLLIKKRKPAWMSFSWVNHSLPQYFMTVHLPKTSPNISNLSYRFEKSDTEVVFYVRFRSCDFNPKILQTNTIITSTGGGLCFVQFVYSWAPLELLSAQIRLFVLGSFQVWVCATVWMCSELSCKWEAYSQRNIPE